MLREQDWQQALAGEVAKAFETLTTQERQVLRVRFGLNDRVHALEDAAHRCGLTWDRAWRVERRALRKLRASAVGARAATPRGLRMLRRGEGMVTLRRGTDEPEQTGAVRGRIENPAPPRPPQQDPPPEREPFDRNLWDEV